MRVMRSVVIGAFALFCAYIPNALAINNDFSLGCPKKCDGIKSTESECSSCPSSEGDAASASSGDNSHLDFVTNNLLIYVQLKMHSMSDKNASLYLYNSNHYSGPAKSLMLSGSWMFSSVYYLRKTPNSSQITLVSPAGEDTAFNKNENGDYLSMPDGTAVIKKGKEGYILEGNGGVRYQFTDFVIHQGDELYAYSTRIQSSSFRQPLNFQYNVTHQLQRITMGPDTVLYKFEYKNDQVERILDGADRLLATLKYNDIQRLVEVNYGEYAGQKNYKYAFEYADGGRIAKKIRPNGGVVTYEYLGDLVSHITDALGHELTITKDNNILRVRNKNGQMLKYQLAPLGNEYVSLEYANGEKIERKLNGRGQIVEKLGGCKSCDSDGNGADSTQYDYNKDGLLIEERFLVGGKVEATRKYERDSRGRKIAVTDKDGGVTKYKYDFNDNVIETTFPDGAVEKAVYNAAGQLVERVDALGLATRADYNSKGEMQRTTYPDGTFEEYYYDGLAYRVGKLDRTGRITYFQYDRLGRLSEEAGPVGDLDNNRKVTLDDAKLMMKQGNFRAWTHDIEGNILTERDNNGNILKNEYDLQWRLARTTFPDGTFVQFARDGEGNEITRRNPDGTYEFKEYNARGRQIRQIFDDGDKIGEIDPKDSAVRYQYNASDQLIATIDRMGNRTELKRDESRHSESIVNALGQTESRENDATGKLTRTIDSHGNVTTYQYNNRGRLVRLLHFDGRITAYEYDRAGRIVKMLLPDGAIIENEYSVSGVIAKETRTAGNVKQVSVYHYAKNGELESVTQDAGAANLVTVYNRDLFGRVVSTTTPDSIVSTRTFDNNGNVLSMSTEAGGLRLSNTSTYDNMNRLVKQTAPSGAAQVNTYNNLGQLVGTSVLNGTDTVTSVSYEYDPKTGRQAIQIANPGTPEAAITKKEFNANGQLVAVTGPTGQATRFEYDPLSRQTSIIDALGNISRTEYSRDNLTVTKVDPNGRATATNVDKQGRVSVQTNEMKQAVQYTYDRNGNRLTLKDANGNVSTWAYDFVNRPVSLTYPNGDVEKYVYNHLGQLVSKTKPDGTQINYEYDKGSRVTRIFTPQGELTYTYDALGRLVEEVDHTLPNKEVGKLTYQYNAVGQMVAVTDHNVNQTVKYDFDSLGRKTRVTVGDHVIEYRYNRSGQLSEVQKNAEAAPARYQYDLSGRRVKLSLPNGVYTDYTYDGAGRLTGVVSKNKEGKILSGTEYTLDKSGNRIAMKLTLDGVVQNVEYRFDNAYRLTRELRKDEKEAIIYDDSFTYDPLGNRIGRLRLMPSKPAESTAYTYNNANQILTETTGSVTKMYSYDKNGNTIGISGGESNVTMTYDWLNRQTSWSDGKNTEKQVYRGAEWKRIATLVEKADGSKDTVKYLYDGDNVIVDLNAENKVLAQYVTPELDQYISMTRDGKTAYYTQDGLGSVRTLTDASGIALNQSDYFAFGEGNAGLSKNVVANRYGYTGRENCGMGLSNMMMYYRSRNYNSIIGRFMSRDLIVYNGGINVYAYCLNSVTRSTDPYGLEGKCKCGLEVGSQLISLLTSVKQLLNDPNHSLLRNSVCWGKLGFENNWDIGELAWRKGYFKEGECGNGSCAQTASVFGECYKTHGINYALWGALGKLCGGSLSTTIAAVYAYRTARNALQIGREGSDLLETETREIWARMGYEGKYGWSNLHTPLPSETANDVNWYEFWFGSTSGLTSYKDSESWDNKNTSARVSNCEACGRRYSGTLRADIQLGYQFNQYLTVDSNGFKKIGVYSGYNPR